MKSDRRPQSRFFSLSHIGHVVLVIAALGQSVPAQAGITVAAPSNLSATSVSASEIKLTWADNSNNENNFIVYRSTGSRSRFKQYAVLAAGVTLLSDTGVIAGNSYSYVVQAKAKSGRNTYYSDYSNEASATPTAAPATEPPPGGGTTPEDPNAIAVQVPIEVFGAAGTVREAIVSVAAADAPTVTRIWMQVYGLSYADKASVQVNDGPWTDINNNTAQVSEPGKSYGGVGGSFATLKLSIPLASGVVRAGSNTVRFRFNRTNGLSMGFRVLAFDFLNAASAKLLPANSFVQEDPSGWKPPYGDQTSIAKGQQLWSSAPLIRSPIDSTPIRATCGDCHARDGRDLKYFNFSNLSIVERSKFHGLTEEDGRLIASFVRTRPTVAPGRPWNPPYQPGPGLDTQPASNWAAGAGLDSVLSGDSDLLHILFPLTVSSATIATSQTLNMRETPVAMQLLDWNRWLPRVHPKDAWGDAFLSSDFLKLYNGEGTGSSTVNLRTFLSTDRAGFIAGSGLKIYFNTWNLRRWEFLTPRGDYSSSWTPDLSQKIYSSALWQLVKTWELVQEFDLESLGTALYGANTEARTWFVNTPFSVAPARLMIPSSSNGIDGSTLETEFLNSAWYHLQVVLNAGNRQGDWQNPVDWPYLYGRVKDLSNASQYAEGMRLFILIVKGMQSFDNGSGPEFVNGWQPRGAADIQTLVNPGWSNAWKNTSASDKATLLTAVADAWLAKSKQYSPSQYYAGGHATASEVPGSNPTGGPWVDKVWWQIVWMKQAGVPASTLNPMCDWAKTVWPLGNWASLKF